MKFRFIGDPKDSFSGPSKVETLGHVFTREDWTEVSDKYAIDKLLGHSHFESGGAFSPVPEAPAVPDEREELIKDATSLGILVDRRWSNQTLSAKIAEAIGE